jgi:hypothetical protein
VIGELGELELARRQFGPGSGCGRGSSVLWPGIRWRRVPAGYRERALQQAPVARWAARRVVVTGMAGSFRLGELDRFSYLKSSGLAPRCLAGVLDATRPPGATHAPGTGMLSGFLLLRQSGDTEGL